MLKVLLGLVAGLMPGVAAAIGVIVFLVTGPGMSGIASA